MSVRRMNTLVIQIALDREVGFILLYKQVISYSRKQIHYFYINTIPVWTQTVIDNLIVKNK